MAVRSRNLGELWETKVPRRKVGIIALGYLASMFALRAVPPGGAAPLSGVYRTQDIGASPSGHTLPCYCPVCSGQESPKIGVA